MRPMEFRKRTAALPPAHMAVEDREQDKENQENQEDEQGQVRMVVPHKGRRTGVMMKIDGLAKDKFGLDRLSAFWSAEEMDRALNSRQSLDSDVSIGMREGPPRPSVSTMRPSTATFESNNTRSQSTSTRQSTESARNADASDNTRHSMASDSTRRSMASDSTVEPASTAHNSAHNETLSPSGASPISAASKEQSTSSPTSVASNAVETPQSHVATLDDSLADPHDEEHDADDNDLDASKKLTCAPYSRTPQPEPHRTRVLENRSRSHPDPPFSGHWRSFPPDIRERVQLESAAMDKTCTRIVEMGRFQKSPAAAQRAWSRFADSAPELREPGVS